MTHKLIFKVKKFQLSIAKRFGTVEEKPPGGGFHPSPPPPPIPFRVKTGPFFCSNIVCLQILFFALHKTSRIGKTNIQKGGVNR